MLLLKLLLQPGIAQFVGRLGWPRLCPGEVIDLQKESILGDVTPPSSAWRP